ncbi:MAG: zf-HC2 domain-containing protein [Chloroflexi bacterium]|nr:zf-HC2 domain-containing protein [Chloroflexota bacterium]MBU1747930.1 zf-HC2 domain-containing protein [Chloroflexota bacterium]
MNCRQVRERKQAYVDASLPADQQQAVAEHLAQCSDCLTRVALARRIQQQLGPTVHQALGEARLSAAAESRIRARLWADLDPDAQPAPWARWLAWAAAPALTLIAVFVLVWVAAFLLGGPLPPTQQAFVTPPASQTSVLAATAVAMRPADTPTLPPSPTASVATTQSPVTVEPTASATPTVPRSPAPTIAPTQAPGAASPTVMVTQAAPSPTRAPDVVAASGTPTTTAGVSWAYYLKGESVTRVVRQADTIWAGTTQGQVVRLAASGEIVRYALPSAKLAAVTGLVVDARGTVWVATMGAGVFMLNVDAGPAQTLLGAGLSSNDISALTVDTTGTVWCGTDATVNRLILQNAGARAGTTPITITQGSYNWQTFVVPVPRVSPPAHQVTTLVAEGAGTLWVGVQGSYRSKENAYLDGGLYRLQIGQSSTWEQVLYANEVGIAQSVYIEPNGRKWVATSPTGDPGSPQAQGGGVVVWGDQEWRFYEASSVGMPSRYVTDVAVDARGRTWIATDRGLAVYTGPQVALYQEDNSGLPSNRVQAVALDPDGGAWLATDVGLCHLIQP